MRPDYAWLNPISLKTLSRGYLREGIAPENLREEAIARAEKIVDTAEEILGFGLPTLRHGIRRGWVSPASPVWSNFGAGRGLPISCNGSFMDDTVDSILWKVAEIGMMSKEGAGTSVYMGALRPEGSPISGGGKSQGPKHFARLVQEQVAVISQGNTRRGNAAIYLDIEHDDIEDWLKIRSVVNGVHDPIQHLSFGVCIGDEWMEEFLAEKKGGSKRMLMTKIINKRKATGYPFIIFTDTANEARPEVLKRRGLFIKASNLCTEIMLPSGPDESFVCDLSSVNLLWWHEWKDTNLVRELIYLLDAVMTEYIDKTKDNRLMADARRFAIKWRALGLGTLGWHSLLQSQMIPFESKEALELNVEVHKHVQEESIAASRYLADRLGEPYGLKGTGMRNLTVNAIAPTTSSSIILGQVSPSIEPWEANIFENDNAKGVFTQRNVHLEELLEAKGRNTNETWLTILQQAGSVQGLDFLSDHEKAVFKTFLEIDQDYVIQQAADRQKFIDQGQSLNLKLHPDTSKKRMVDLIVDAWAKGVKSLYYHRGLNEAQELARENACLACEA